MPSCHPAASVTVTTVGMISTIFGISRVVSSIRAGIDSRPMIGPSTNPRNRSMIVHAAPPATCRNSSGHSLLAAMPAISSAEHDRHDRQPRARDDLEVRSCSRGGCADPRLDA